MTLSRTARILIAILLLASAAFFWVNFFYQEQVTPFEAGTSGVLAEEAIAPTALAQADPAEDPAAATGTDAPASGQAADGTSPAAGATTDATTAAPPEDGAPTVVVPSAPEVVTRDFDISELPFLITEPPSPEAIQEALEVAAALTRTQGSRRASVNPFSPIIIQAAPPAATAPPTAQPLVTEVAVPGQPAAAVGMPTVTSAEIAAGAAPLNAPAPRPLAPPAPRADGLPRQLPGGAPLGATPDLLRQALTVPEITHGDLEAVAAVREPGAAGEATLAPVTVAASTPLEDAPVEPIGPAARVAPAGSEAPLVAGVDHLSRYLRDNNVVFTGSVLGPVAVGVFRSAEAQTPLVVTLGQTLPETEIVLTDLTGLKAEFTLADSTQVLSLDLRR